ncbi:hypothetical protein [Aquincola sp. J276]|uniref:hypothetical protein n=1 Tax=Aquincola sp. J276 TaxID=2898432 RepID=UPI002150E04F|nr:hypothetical protein [Aquincola sp. J276]MCR5867728.1 hypothetical protein [Aquincola sp. J276]
MNTRRASLLLVASLVCSAAPAAESPEQIVDPVIDAVLASLAIRWGYNLLSAPDEGAASIGKVYYVTTPACAGDLVRMAEEGVPVRVFQALTLSQPLPSPPVRKEWVSVRIDSVILKGARATLYAKLPSKTAELDAAFEALRRTNAQVLVGSRSIGAFDVKRAVASEFQAQGIRQVVDLGGNGATGALAPHAELILQKFEFDQELAKAAQVGFWVRFLELFGVRLAGEQSSRVVQGFKLPTFSTMAFKPVASLFSDHGCTKP